MLKLDGAGQDLGRLRPSFPSTSSSFGAAGSAERAVVDSMTPPRSAGDRRPLRCGGSPAPDQCRGRELLDLVQPGVGRWRARRWNSTCRSWPTLTVVGLEVVDHAGPIGDLAGADTGHHDRHQVVRVNRVDAGAILLNVWYWDAKSAGAARTGRSGWHPWTPARPERRTAGRSHRHRAANWAVTACVAQLLHERRRLGVVAA